MPAKLILAFDTSAAHCAAALLRGDEVVTARLEPMAKGQAERLMPLLEELLAEVGVGWRDLAAIAVGIGPGNFTGIRISVAAARGLALSLRIPAIGVGTLEALALDLPRPVLAVTDARRGEVYAQGFGAGPAEPRLMTAEALTDLPPGLALVGDGAAVLHALRPDLRELPPALPFAEALARITAARLARGQPQPRPAPLYLRSADAAPASDPPPVLLP
ncbi:tRNA (adenosine(37)-N6)-threonylcarbamoyltransferase complex dimerization subunit type 1 TsaB [Frigidibacter sp.]|uniref:tRNA (adenosine(37)-N6)-threonylcarbamoyltransferase complex dimerization subunit type 1 TsaB n=1 Tax=Frigidibacter sp. TaxID=2586418 RepID=UPI002735F1FA|nr:tRNA (adenosine(37)-N6)-threonylcarbamoyltransferase complex dimerization subunit type 1 TsaB [Frigidibacter sp.]MDP3339033.1 tRNA (adenosine(37)-N6)-threonylcarbamoyltransferase complex dimerization subunit type 1 TsaB [Frigidibacter sp.]